MDFKSVYCNNCGGRGHLYRDCKKPISSYGNIIYKIDCNDPSMIHHNYRNYIQGVGAFSFNGNTGELIIPTSDRGTWASEKNLLQS